MSINLFEVMFSRTNLCSFIHHFVRKSAKVKFGEVIRRDILLLNIPCIASSPLFPVLRIREMKDIMKADGVYWHGQSTLQSCNDYD